MVVCRLARSATGGLRPHCSDRRKPRAQAGVDLAGRARAGRATCAEYSGGVVVGFSLVSLRLARDSDSEGSENWGTMPNTFRDGSSRDRPSRHGPLAAAISDAVVQLFSEHTGRGPTKARTTVDGELVAVVLRGSMTQGERALVGGGKHDEVLRLRRAFQDTMSEELVAVVERLTERNVEAFMSANHIDPDAAAEIFLLDGAVDVADRFERTRS